MPCFQDVELTLYRVPSMGWAWRNLGQAPTLLPSNTVVTVVVKDGKRMINYLINHDVGPHFISSKLVYRVMK